MAELYSTVGWKTSKMQKQREELKKELLIKKEAAVDDLGGSQGTQDAKDAKMRKFIAGKACSELKPEGMARKPFAEQTRYVTQVSD